MGRNRQRSCVRIAVKPDFRKGGPTVDMLTQVLELFSRFAVIGGGLRLVWGAIVAGGALFQQIVL